MTFMMELNDGSIYYRRIVHGYDRSRAAIPHYRLIPQSGGRSRGTRLCSGASWIWFDSIPMPSRCGIETRILLDASVPLMRVPE